MAIAFDAITDGTDNGGSTNSLTFNHTATGSNLIGFVCILGDNITGGNDDISSVTWGGAACTFIQKYNGTDRGSDRFCYIYAIKGPGTGSKSIVVTAGSTHYLLAMAVSYTGADQTTNPIESSTANDVINSTNLVTNLTTTVDNSWIILMAQGIPLFPPSTAGTGATRRAENAAFHNYTIYDSGGALTPAGAKSLTARWDNTGGNSTIGVTSVAVSFKPIAVASTYFAANLEASGIIKRNFNKLELHKFDVPTNILTFPPVTDTLMGQILT